MNKKSINILFISFIFIGIILGIGYLFYININNNKQMQLVNAVVKYKAPNYIIVTDENNKEYKLKTKANMEVGDMVNLNINKVEDNKEPIEAEIESINGISKPISFTVKDTKDTNNVEDKTNNDIKENSISKEEKIENNINYKEEDLIGYANNINNDIDKNINIKDRFVSLIDFLFYDKELYGYKFSEVSNNVKLKLLSILLSIDKKIDSKFPDYKEWVTSNGQTIYNNIKNKAVEQYLEITNNICSNNESTCSEAIKGLTDIKNNFSITWDTLKNIFKNNKEKLKNYYEIWRRS